MFFNKNVANNALKRHYTFLLALYCQEVYLLKIHVGFRDIYTLIIVVGNILPDY